MKLALIADWLPTFGGAEHVLAEFHALWPTAPIFTTVARRGALGPLDQADIRMSKLQFFYRIFHRHEILLPWMPRVIERIDLQEYDVILSSSHAVAKGIVPPSSAVHVCYCHTPMRYAWEMEEEYIRDFGIPAFLRKRVKRFLSAMRRWDLRTAKRVDVFVANSATTQERIARIYGRESTVIRPPVDDRFFHSLLLPSAQRQGFLAIGRLVPYKRFDLLIEAANLLKFPLTIVGAGRDVHRLKALAGPTVTFLGRVEDDALPRIYGSAKALLFPQIEDAGVVLEEAQACGTPVIALRKGGATETVIEGKTGLFFDEQTLPSLQVAIEQFNNVTFDAEGIREHARQFSVERFRREILNVVSEASSNHSVV
ncbi:MAG: glycosyltransferase [Candidatus Peregrinibacteria bacterium]